tara:strand:- start:218 stop:595 length:378 start_codon:yes stop_codon:yes gene_type:complete
MKKLTLSVAILLGSISAKAQTEYVELKSNKMFRVSFASYYGDSYKPLDEDLEVSTIKNSGYHWVTYEGVAKVVVILADDNSSYGETERKICINDKCARYYSEQRIYNFKINDGDTLKFYYPNYNE